MSLTLFCFASVQLRHGFHIFAAMFFLSGLVHAHVVGVRVGENQRGNGYMFLNWDGRCLVVTAAHVVAKAGKIVPADEIILEDGRRLPQVQEVYQPIASKDVAVLKIAEKATNLTCSSSRLAVTSSISRLRKMRNGVLVTLGSTKNEKPKPVKLDEMQTSNDGFLFALVSEEDRMLKGWSGGIVFDDDQVMVGLVVNALKSDNRKAIAIRADVVAAIVEKTKQAVTPLRQSARSRRIELVAGSPVEVLPRWESLRDCPPTWRFKPDGRNAITIVISAADEVSQTFKSFSVSSYPNPIKLVAVLKGPKEYGALTNWVNVRTCSFKVPTKSAVCELPPQDANSSIKIVLAFSENSQSQLGCLAME